MSSGHHCGPPSTKPPLRNPHAVQNYTRHIQGPDNMNEKSHLVQKPHLQSSSRGRERNPRWRDQWDGSPKFLQTWKMIRTIRVDDSSRVHIDASNDPQVIVPLCSVHLLTKAMKRLTQYLAALGLMFYGSGLAEPADRSAPRTALTHRPWSHLRPFITWQCGGGATGGASED